MSLPMVLRTGSKRCGFFNLGSLTTVQLLDGPNEVDMPMVSFAFRATAAPFVAGVLLLAPASTVPQARPAALDDATIVHVLDRTGFGARAEDVARVRELGLDRYLDEQLHPERLSDAEVRARLAGFQTLALDSSTIAAALLRAAAARAPRQQEGGRRQAGRRRRTRGRDMDPAERARRRELRESVRVPMDELGAAEDPPRRLLAAPARGSARRLLVQPLQRLRRQGPGARLPDRVRARRDPAARPRPVPRSARRGGEEPGDALLSGQLAERRSAGGRGHDAPPRSDRRRRRRARPDRPAAARAAHGREGDAGGDRADQAADAARPERELRARADGAAHARRRRRLHAGGRRRGRAGVHRLDDPRPAPGRRLRVRRAPAREGPEDRARDDDRRRRRGRRRSGARSARGAPVDRDVHRHQAGAALRRRRAAAGAGRRAPPRRSPARAAICARSSARS